MRDGIAQRTRLMYLQARETRRLRHVDEDTLTVKRQRPGTRFLFVEYPRSWRTPKM